MRVIYYIVFALWYIASLLPLFVLYFFSDILYVLIYKIFSYRIHVVRNNLKASFPKKTDKELKQTEQHFYHCLCDYFVESLKTMSMSEKQMRQRMVFKGTDIVDQCIADGQSCAVYLGHLFNWEWITSLPLWVSKDAHCGQLYHALENPLFDRLSLAWRQRWGAECIPLVDILRKTIEYKQKKQPTVFGYIGDQVPHWNNIHHWCQFLNHDTPVMSGADRIAIKNKQALFYIDVHRVKRGHYEAEFKLITREPEKLKEFESVDIFFQMLEKNIQREPELWLWSHNRWKRTHEEFDRRFVVVNGKVVPKENTEA